MSETIIVAILALVGTLGGSYFANQKTAAVMDERMKNIREDISSLSERVSKHNNLVERMVAVEQSTKSAHKRLDDAGVGRETK